MLTDVQMTSLYKYANWVARNKENGDDLFQNAMLAYLLNKDKIEPGKEVAYLKTGIWREKVLNEERCYNRDRDFKISDMWNAISIDSILDDYIMEQEIIKFSHTLSKPQQLAFLYCLFFCDDKKQAAKDLNVNEAAFNYHWRSAWMNYRKYVYGIPRQSNYRQ